MERPFTVLEKKLAELESQLTQLFYGSTDEDENKNPDTTAACHRQTVFQRIEFLKALLAAEKECHPCVGPAHLAHVEGRLAAVDDAFRKWADRGVAPEAGFGELLACSCTDACFGEGGTEEDGGGVKEEAECFVPPTSKDVEILESGGSGRDERGSEKEDERKHWGFYCRHFGFLGMAAVAAAAAIGNAAMKFGSSGEEEVFLVPT